ncbi:MAG: GNAT family N-acetyltransferase [Alphaproteobacteria bacterium]|nr:GNAT family N-acetyltransferase [Alphaproteobacteria bacterium]
MHVDPEFRGRGIGNALPDALESSLIADGIVIAHVQTGVRQPDAMALYEDHGYAHSPFVAYGEDPLTMFNQRRLA